MAGVRMRLYGTLASPFVARVRIQIQAKGLPIDLVPPPDGTGPARLHALFPLGRIPVLEADGALIPESAVIQEYLEDRFPAPPLRGCTTLETARVRLIARAVDLYLVPALQPLRAATAAGEQRGLEPARQHLARVLEQLQALLGPGPFALAESLTLADCALLPVMFYLERFAAALPLDFARTRWPQLDACVAHAARQPAASAVLESMVSAAGPPRAAAMAAAGTPPREYGE